MGRNSVIPQILLNLGHWWILTFRHLELQSQFRQNRTILGEMRATLSTVDTNFYKAHMYRFSKIFQFHVFATIFQSFAFS